MREVHRSQFQLGQVPIEEIWINPKSRDDIPAVLKGLQHIWSDEELRARLLALLDEHILPEADRTVGRPGMDLWQILVLGVLKQGLGCDFDRLHDLTNHHGTIREFLGHGDFDDKTRYEYQTVVDNVSLLTPELLSAVGRLVVESGHKVAKKKLGEPLRGRCDSFVVETDVHYPTDVSLLWDATRCLLRETGRAAEKYAVRGWRQWRHLSREVKKLFNKVRATRRAQRHPERVEAYVARCRALVERTEATLDALRDQGVGELSCRSITGLVAHARRQIDQVERRLLRGETIPHEEKVFSIFEGHTRWISKGKAGTPVELGVPVALIEDQYQFILHHKVLWEGEDVDVAVPMVQEAQALYPELRACSFDRGFHSRGNRGPPRCVARRQCVAGERVSFKSRPGAGRRGVVCGRAACASGDRVCHQWVGTSGTRPRSQPWCGGLRACGCLVGAGGQPASHRIDPAEAGAQTTTTRRLTDRP